MNFRKVNNCANGMVRSGNFQNDERFQNIPKNFYAMLLELGNDLKLKELREKYNSYVDCIPMVNGFEQIKQNNIVVEKEEEQVKTL